MICVFLIHTYDKINISLIRTLISKLSLGNVVATFFVISGFLAFASEKEETTLEYYKNRFLRIYLVYWITFHVNLYIKCIWLKQLKFDCVRYFIGVCGLQMAIPSQDYSWNGLGASGSLSAFIVFYALVPIFRKIIKNEKQAWLLCGGGVFAVT
jgi:peptidoglycan/LPS O-acetylase OafA/YrhL